MQTAIAIVTHTPAFVWIILVVLCARAWQSMRIRWVSLFALLTVPILFVAGGIQGLSAHTTTAAAGWVLLAAIMAPLGIVTAPRPLAIDRARRRLQMPPSILVPIRLLIVFVVRYALAVATAMLPDQHLTLLLVTSLFSGAVTGYYLGWSGALLHAYWRPGAIPCVTSPAA